MGAVFSLYLSALLLQSEFGNSKLRNSKFQYEAKKDNALELQNGFSNIKSYISNFK